MSLLKVDLQQLLNSSFDMDLQYLFFPFLSGFELLTFSSQVAPKNSSRATPLNLAVKCGHCNVIKVLLDNKASMDIDGQSVLMHSAASSHGGKALRLLIEHGADVN